MFLSSVSKTSVSKILTTGELNSAKQKRKPVEPSWVLETLTFALLILLSVSEASFAMTCSSLLRGVGTNEAGNPKQLRYNNKIALTSNTPHDLPADREVVATITLYNGNTLRNPTFGGESHRGQLLIEKWCEENQIAYDFTKPHGKPGGPEVDSWEVKLGAKDPNVHDKRIFGDLLRLVLEDFLTNFYVINRSPKMQHEILENHMIYGRVLSPKLAHYYSTFGFEVLELRPGNPPQEITNLTKLETQTANHSGVNYMIRASVSQLVKHQQQDSTNWARIKFIDQFRGEPDKHISVSADDWVIQTPENPNFERQGHAFDPSSGHSSGDYSTALLAAKNLVVTAYGSSSQEPSYAQTAIAALDKERALGQPLRQRTFVITQNKNEDNTNGAAGPRRDGSSEFKKLYTRTYKKANATRLYKEALNWFTHQALQHVQANSTLVEGGTGAGVMGMTIRKMLERRRIEIKRSLHFDLNPEMISLADETGIPKEDLSVSDILNLKDSHGKAIANNSVDFFYSHSVIWNLRRPDLEKFFLELRRISKPGAKAVISTLLHKKPYAFCRELRRQLEEIKQRSSLSYLDIEEIVVSNRRLIQNAASALSIEEFTALAENYGFRVIETKKLYKYKALKLGAESLDDTVNEALLAGYVLEYVGPRP